MRVLGCGFLTVVAYAVTMTDDSGTLGAFLL
jgi:hypothetical protein